MSLIRDIRQRQAELAALRALLERASKEPFSKPLLESRAADLEREIAEMEQNPVSTPETEIFLRAGLRLDHLRSKRSLLPKSLAATPILSQTSTRQLTLGT